MNRKIIFIGGIHGVGKGTICDKIANDYQVTHFSASDVLKWGEVNEGSNKLVDDIDAMQQRLISGLNKLITDDNLYLLDGHYCLLNSKKQPEEISQEIFQLINPLIFVIVIEKPKIIFERLKQRDNIDYDLTLLEKMQNMEINYAKYLASKFNLPYIEIIDGDVQELKPYL